MPVTRIASAQRAQELAGHIGDHTIDVDIAVPASAGEFTYGFAIYAFTSPVSLSGDPVDIAWEGSAPVPMLESPLLFGSNENLLMGWVVESPTSAKVEVSHENIGSSGFTPKARYLTVGVWSQAQPLDLENIEDLVVSAVGTSNATSHTLTVPSILPASRVITGHLVPTKKRITSYNGTRVASAGGTGKHGQLLMGEVRGAEEAESTVGHTNGLWGAIGLNLDPAPLTFGAKGTHRAGKGSFGGSVYRFAEPHPDRYYVVPPVGSMTNVLAGNFVPSADGVLMPVWPKDPDDTSDYTLDWSNHLAADDRITHVEHTVSGSLRKFSEALDDTGVMTQVWINGSTVNVTRSVRVRAATAKGRRFDRTFWLVGASN